MTGVNNVVAANIGATGIYASNIIPLNGSEATFGGAQTYTFPAGITMNGALSGVTSFSAGSFNSSTAISTFLGGTGNALAGIAGFIQIGQQSALNIIYDFDSIQARNNGASATLQLNPLGGAVTANGAPLPPVYTATGAAAASTMHIVTGTTTFASISNNTTVSNVIALSGAAAFSSISSYFVFCTVSGYSGAPTGGGITPLGSNSTGSQFDVSAFNTTGGTLTTVNVSWLAIGT